MSDESRRIKYTRRCVADGCTATFPGSKWDSIRAGDTGWFFTKVGDAYCPEHVPEWVPAWRARQKKSV